jgi:hypothetical protein
MFNFKHHNGLVPKKAKIYSVAKIILWINWSNIAVLTVQKPTHYSGV